MKVEQAIEYLERGFREARIATAYIFAGSPQGQAAVLAERMAATVLCEAQSGPCGECRGCHQAARRVHPDLLWVEPQKKSRQISVEQVRSLQRHMLQTAFCGGWKVAVIAAADRLNASASNAFLKTLEEPPGRGVFLLLTDSPQFLLPTIRSRCQYIALDDAESGPPEGFREELCKILAAKTAPGRLGDMARTGATMELFKLLRTLAEEDLARETGEDEAEEETETLEARVNARYREMRSGMMRALLQWYRDILLLVCGADADTLYYPEYEEAMKARAASLDYRKALRGVGIVQEMNRRLEGNMPDEVVLYDGFSRLPR
jgi:DNA polymerase III delta' subunit